MIKRFFYYSFELKLVEMLKYKYLELYHITAQCFLILLWSIIRVCCVVDLINVAECRILFGEQTCSDICMAVDQLTRFPADYGTCCRRNILEAVLFCSWKVSIRDTKSQSKFSVRKLLEVIGVKIVLYPSTPLNNG